MHGNINSWLYANQALLCTNTAENRDCPITSDVSLPYRVSVTSLERFMGYMGPHLRRCVNQTLLRIDVSDESKLLSNF